MIHFTNVVVIYIQKGVVQIISIVHVCACVGRYYFPQEKKRVLKPTMQSGASRVALGHPATMHMHPQILKNDADATTRTPTEGSAMASSARSASLARIIATDCSGGPISQGGLSEGEGGERGKGLKVGIE